MSENWKDADLLCDAWKHFKSSPTLGLVFVLPLPYRPLSWVKLVRLHNHQKIVPILISWAPSSPSPWQDHGWWHWDLGGLWEGDGWKVSAVIVITSPHHETMTTFLILIRKAVRVWKEEQVAGKWWDQHPQLCSPCKCTTHPLYSLHHTQLVFYPPSNHLVLKLFPTRSPALCKDVHAIGRAVFSFAQSRRLCSGLVWHFMPHSTCIVPTLYSPLAELCTLL